MEKLTIEHLAPYLPYELNILLEGKVVVLIGLDSPYKTNDNYYLKGQVKKPNGTYRETHSVCITERTADLFKPLLLPLSSLTTNQWISVFTAGINGLKVPYPKNSTGEYSVEYHDNAVELLLNSVDSITYDFIEKQFSSDARFNQHAAFNKIFELHGDIDFLIEKGLAIDINTISHE